MQASFFELLKQPEVRETVEDVVRELRAKAPCDRCSLSVLNPSNRGVMYRGNPAAKIAILDIAPGGEEMQQGRPLAGRAGGVFEKWMSYLKIDTKQDVFITSVVQCAPPFSKDKEGYPVQRAPNTNELAACWYPRSLRMIQAMANLECVVILGFPAAQAICGGKPIAKTHEGRWFVSSLLPGIPIFCLDHPLLGVGATPEKKGKTKVILDCFRREYLETRKVVGIAKNTSLQDAVFPDPDEFPDESDESLLS